MIHEKLTQIQNELKVPKNQYNTHGNYKYRSCEDILEAVKPLLLKHKATLMISDELKEMGGVLFIEATCVFKFKDAEIVTKSQAGIDIHRKGMDVAQCFGASSTYSRKYALNALLLTDDSPDPDATNVHDKTKPAVKRSTPSANIWYCKVGYEHINQSRLLDGARFIAEKKVWQCNATEENKKILAEIGAVVKDTKGELVELPKPKAAPKPKQPISKVDTKATGEPF
tara:strand:+ start:696 stop:1376 length:681 start_codon:yes stop_codon:yes gene_type:complete